MKGSFVIIIPFPLCILFFKIDLNGKLIVAKLGMKILTCLTAEKIDRKCFNLVGRSLSFVPCGFVLTGDVPVRVNLNPSYSMLSQVFKHFPALNCKLASSNAFMTSLTFVS